MTLRQAAAVIEQATLGVGHAHKQGVIHRDSEAAQRDAQPHRRQRVREGARLRPREGDGAGRRGAAHLDRPGARHAAVHAARAGRRREASTTAPISIRSPASSTTASRATRPSARTPCARRSRRRSPRSHPMIVDVPQGRAGARRDRSLLPEGPRGRARRPLPIGRGVHRVAARRALREPPTRVLDAVPQHVAEVGQGVGLRLVGRLTTRGSSKARAPARR
jgi:hypothetical protein